MHLKRSTLVAALVGAALLLLSIAPQQAARADNHRSLEAVPFTFVGNAHECSGTAGSRIVTSAWLNGFGLPDDGTSMNGVPSSARDPHSGLLLSKNGPTADCSSAGVNITGLGHLAITATFELGFDFRDGTHCGAGAPRFNVTTSDNNTYFFGCADGTLSSAPQDPAQWSRVRFTATQAAPQLATNPPFATETSIRSISIVYDEGTDTPTAQDPNGVGLVNLDNIDINGTLITSGPSHGKKDDTDQSHGGDQ